MVGIRTTSTKYSSEILLRVKGFSKMDWLMIDVLIAVVLIGITIVLLAKVVGEEISADLYEYRRRNRWKKRFKKRRKK